MMPPAVTLTAVLTGDLIGSTEVAPAQVERSMSALADAAAFIARDSANPENRFTRFRGDGWQMNLGFAGAALRVAIYLNAVIRADPDCVPTRIAIGLGAVESLGDEGLAAARGTAFTHSGRALDTMAPGQTLALVGETTDDLQRSLVDFIADRMSGWSQEQAEVIALKLRHGDASQQDLAVRLGITRQAVAARLQAAGQGLIWRAATAFSDSHKRKAP